MLQRAVSILLLACLVPLHAGAAPTYSRLLALAEAEYTISRQGGDVELLRRAPKAFAAALAFGKKSEWYDDALHPYGQFLDNRGTIKSLPGGGYKFQPDFVETLVLYRRVRSERHEESG